VSVKQAQAAAAADAIEEAFVWDETPQGYEYWDGVFRALRQMAATPDIQVPCPACAGTGKVTAVTSTAGTTDEATVAP
jgi:hypothetical protein